MKTIFTLTIALFLSLSSFSQVDPYSEDVKKCITSNGTLSYYEGVIDQMFVMLQEQFKSQEVPESVWNEVKELRTTSMKELAQMLVSAYRGHFSHKDVKTMNDLYGSKAGKNMFKPEKLTEGDKVILSDFYKSDTGQKVLGSQESITEAMSKISEMWSGDLYKSVIEKLSEKGFNL